MKNYTTQTAALKATTIDTRLLDAKQINTEKLFINGELFDPSNFNGGTSEPSQIKESPNEAMFNFYVFAAEGEDYAGVWQMKSTRYEQHDDSLELNTLYDFQATLQKGSESEGQLENGIYAVVPINDGFVKCIGGHDFENDTDTMYINNVPSAQFHILKQEYSSANNSIVQTLEKCILENFIFGQTDINLQSINLSWVIKLCEEDDNLSELYGGVLSEEMPGFAFLISIPYYIPETTYIHNTSSTYSLRKPQQTNLFSNLSEKIEEMRQRFEEIKQQNLDNPTE